jgi:ATP-dependent helicase/nuclease subunit A
MDFTRERHIHDPMPSQSPPPEREQQEAIDYRGSLCVLSSGAGCGKTYVLTNRYASLIREGLGVDQIAAITFTNKAAREMKAKIRAALPHLRLETAPIQTMHSFGQSLIQAHAEKLGLPADVRLDDRPGARRTRAVREGLERLLTTPLDLTDAAKNIVVLFGWRETVKLFEGLLFDADQNAWNRFLGKTVDQIANDWLTLRERIQPIWVDYLAKCDPKIAPCLTALQRIAAPNPSLQNAMMGIVQSFHRLGTSRNWEQDLEDLNELAKVKTIGTKRQWNSAVEQSQLLNHLKNLRDCLKSAFAVFAVNDHAAITPAAELALAVTGIAQCLHEGYIARKRADGVIDHGDQIELARDLLRDHPDVRQAVARQYQAVLVDEFQDTDPTQLELVQLVCGGEDAPDRLFVVGDEKQSIYRFRGAEQSLFELVRSRAPSQGRLSLTVNRRSTPTIIAFVNDLFAEAFPEYEPMTTTRQPNSDDPPVEFLWTQPDKNKPYTSEQRAAEAATIARRILELIGQGVRKRDIVLLFRKLTDSPIYEQALRDHGIDYHLVGGFAFFAQQEIYDLQHLVQAIEDPTDDLALVGLLRSPFVGMSDDALTLLAEPGEVLFDQLTVDRKVDALLRADREALQRFLGLFSGWRKDKDSFPVAVLLNRCIAEAGYDAALQFEPLADRKLANLWKLMELARAYDVRSVGFAGFVAEIADAVERELKEGQAATRPESDDVVRMMTVHKAKGLQFPVVFVPDLAAKDGRQQTTKVRWHRDAGLVAKNPSDLTDDDPEWRSELPNQIAELLDTIGERQEDLRILYVALTRAERQLILSACWPKRLEAGTPTAIPSDVANVTTLLLASRFDLVHGHGLVAGMRAKAIANIRENNPSERNVSRQLSPGPWLPMLPGDVAHGQS